MSGVPRSLVCHRVDYRYLPDIPRLFVSALLVKIVTVFVLQPLIDSELLVPLANRLRSGLFHGDEVRVVCKALALRIEEERIVKTVKGR
ncbi:hypothetical protein D3C78_1242530 [compost metagenome]